MPARDTARRKKVTASQQPETRPAKAGETRDARCSELNERIRLSKNTLSGTIAEKKRTVKVMRGLGNRGVPARSNERHRVF